MDAPTINLAGLYVAERSRLRQFIGRIVGNRSTAEDIVHDAFIKFMGSASGDAIKDERAYLARIARNLAIDHRRQQRPVVSLDDAELFTLADPTPSAETALADRQALRLTFQIIAGMPDTTRRAFEMHRLGEQTLAEIARELGMSNAHAGRLVMAGYKTVRDRLRELGCE